MPLTALSGSISPSGRPQGDSGRIGELENGVLCRIGCAQAFAKLSNIFPAVFHKGDAPMLRILVVKGFVCGGSVGIDTFAKSGDSGFQLGRRIAGGTSLSCLLYTSPSPRD